MDVRNKGIASVIHKAAAKIRIEKVILASGETGRGRKYDREAMIRIIVNLRG